jgi:DNA replication and repair protein RecF
VELIDLSVERFRNLRIDELVLGKGVNLVLGQNGVGKTGLLEAMAVFGNLRSFRETSPRRLVRHGDTSYRIVGAVLSGGRIRRLAQLVQLGPPVKRQLELDGASIDVPRYLAFFPVSVISGCDRELVMGGPEWRRAMLDRFVFLLQNSHLDSLRAYRRALRQRNAALAAQADDIEVELWELPLASAAARVIRARLEGVQRLAANFAPTCRSLGSATTPTVFVGYRGDVWWDGDDSIEKLVEKHLQRYNETRPRDRLAGFTADGPHRHDLSLRTEGRSARHVLSTGQVKVVAAALRLATHAEIERERGQSLPVIVDDVDAELDSSALVRLVSHLGHERQLFLSSTSDRIGGAVSHRTRRFWLEDGACVRQEAETDE